MDFYGYYMERFSWGSNSYSAIEECQRIVTELLDNPTIPFRIAIGSATGLLVALADYAGNGCMVSKSYGDVLLALNESLYIQQTVVEAIDQEWNQKEKAVEIHPDDIPLDDPGYAVELVDLEGADPDDGKGDWAPDAFYHAVRERYVSEGEPCTTDVRNPFPDWGRIDKWTQTDWEKLQIYSIKVSYLPQLDIVLTICAQPLILWQLSNFISTAYRCPGGRNCSYWLRKLWMR